MNQTAINIKVLREQKGMTQEELSEKSGVPRGTIAKFENGWSDIYRTQFRNVIGIANALGTTCEELAYGKPEKADPNKNLEN